MREKLSFLFRRDWLNRFKRPVPPTLVVVFILAAFVLGYVVAQPRTDNRSLVSGSVSNVDQAPPFYLSHDVDFSLFWQVWKFVHDNYVNRSISDTKLFYGAIEGMVAGLNDPYSVFMDPQTAKDFGDELTGSFDGIGAEIGVKDGNLVIVAPLPGTPAERAGIKSGDRILAIDNTDTTGMAVDKAVNMIRGQRGTKVKLLVQPVKQSVPQELEITRDKIVLKIVDSEMKKLPNGNQVAYIKLVQFSNNSNALFKEAWRKLAAQGPKGIIFDLRNNPGGYLDQGVAVASHWIKQGTVVIEKAPKAPDKPYPSSGLGELSQIPTVVLVNGGSASAAEIVTGALQDYGLATVVGEKTFGKGSVQNLQDFPDGSAIKLTIAKWYTPKDRSIDKNGLIPDIEVTENPKDLVTGKDTQLERALQLLNR